MGIFFLEVNRFFINLGLYRNGRKAEEFCFFFYLNQVDVVKLDSRKYYSHFRL